MKILLIGPPASGKSTVGELLSKELNLPIINTGKILRSIKKDTPNYLAVMTSMANGKLVSNEIVGKLLLEETARDEYKAGYILDGWMRQLSDKDFFFPDFDKVIFFSIPEEVVIERTQARRACTLKNHSYNLITSPPKVEGLCDIDGSPLISRIDDSITVVKHRLQEFKKLTVPTIKFFKDRGILLEVDGSGNPEAVFARTELLL